MVSAVIYFSVLINNSRNSNTLYNECLRHGCFPKRWKKVEVIPIAKSGKGDPMDPSKFRPVSLINVGGKVLEQIKSTQLCITYTQSLES
jgi:hypothetical protein